MGCIHPGQIPVIHSAFDPSPEELEKAKIIVEAYEKALLEGRGVVSVGTKMIDPPVVKRAQRLLEHATRTESTNRGEGKK
jgi:citrate lyase subunit beta/citryl-CoA lyase